MSLRMLMAILLFAGNIISCDTNFNVNTAQSRSSADCNSKDKSESCSSSKITPTIKFVAQDEANAERMFSVEFNEAVTGFDKEDITVENGTIIELTGSDKSYSGKVRANGTGVVKIAILASVLKIDNVKAVESATMTAENSNIVEWTFSGSSTTTSSATAVYGLPLVDASDWQTSFFGQWSFVPQPNYMRSHALRNLNFDDIQVVHGAYTYRWTSEGTIDRGRALYKSSSTFNNEALGTKLFQVCANSWGLPQVLVKTNNLIYFSVDTNCDGFMDILTVNLTTDAVNTVTTSHLISINSLEDCFVGDKIIAVTYSITDGYEIWSSDGTTGGTGLIVSATAGINGNYMTGCASTSSEIIFGYNTTGASAYRIGKWNGTTAASTWLTSFTSVYSFIELAGLVYFRGATAADGDEIWRTDGTSGGTSLYKSFYAGATGSYSTMYKISDSKLVFSGSSPSGVLMSTTDGTNLVNFTVSWPSSCTAFKAAKTIGNFLYVNFSDYGCEVYSRINLLTDTKEDFLSGSNAIFTINWGGATDMFCQREGSLFMANVLNDGILKVDSSNTISSIVSSYFVKYSSTSFFYQVFVSSKFGVSCAFAGLSDNITYMKPDQTFAESRRGLKVADLPTKNNVASDIVLVNYFPDHSDRQKIGSTNIYKVSKTGTTEFVSLESTLTLSASGNTMYAFDPTSKVLSAINVQTGAKSTVKDFDDLGATGSLKFLGSGSQYTYLISTSGLYRTDGTSGGTILVSSGLDQSDSNIVSLGGFDYLAARHTSTGFGLYQTNGAASNLTKVGNLSGSNATLSNYLNGIVVQVTASILKFYDGSTFANLTNDTYFATTVYPTYVNIIGNEMFYGLNLNSNTIVRHRRQDGTFRNASDLWSSAGLDLNVYEAIVLAGKVYVPAKHSTSGMGLWRFDLDFANPVEIKNLKNGSNDAVVQFFEKRGDKLFFSSDAGGTGVELWVSDGTSVGTKIVSDLVANGSSHPYPLNRTLDNKIFVVADSPGNKRGVYLLDIP